MCEIIDNAYADDELCQKYKWFSLKIHTKHRKSMVGCYDIENHIVNIYNLESGGTNNIQTLLHEVSHHIDWVQNGKTGHQKPFYAAYRKLLYSALDLGKLDIKTVEKYLADYYSDSKKIQKMLDEYVPHKPVIQRTKTDEIVHVFNCFDQKEDIKKKKYHWDAISKSWCKETKNSKTEIEWLKKLGIKEENISVLNANKMSLSTLKGNKQIKAFDAYKIKDKLKKRGYRWDSNNQTWYFTGTDDKINLEARYLTRNDVGYIIVD